MSKKVTLALIVIVLIVVLVAAVYYSFNGGNTSKVTAGVKAGDVFTYQLVGYTDLHEDIAVPAEFVDINSTKYYRVEITKVEVPIVSYTVTWEFNNGTKFNYDGRVNLGDGSFYAGGRAGGVCEFYGIYAANLPAGSLSRPSISRDTFNPTISETQIKQYLDGDRETNFLQLEYELYDPTDQTFTKNCYVYAYVHFDKQTGMMVEYKTLELYNSPEIILKVEYTIVSSNVIKVS